MLIAHGRQVKTLQKLKWRNSSDEKAEILKGIVNESPDEVNCVNVGESEMGFTCTSKYCFNQLKKVKKPMHFSLYSLASVVTSTLAIFTSE